MLVVRLIDSSLRYAADVTAAFVVFALILVLALGPIALGISLATCAAVFIGPTLGGGDLVGLGVFLAAIGFYAWYVAPLIQAPADAAVAALNGKPAGNF